MFEHFCLLPQSDDDGCSAGDGLNQDGLKRQRGTPVKVRSECVNYRYAAYEHSLMSPPTVQVVDLDMQSPARKTRRFTPTTQGAVDALMCLVCILLLKINYIVKVCVCCLCFICLHF